MSTQPSVKKPDETVHESLPQAQEPSIALHDWRNTVLNIFLPLASLAIFPAVVQTALQVINDPQIEWQGAAPFVFFYLILLFVTIRRNLGATTRSWIVISLVYLTGVVAMVRGGLAGDGTIYLTVLPILAITLINARIGMYSAGLSIITYSVFGIFAYYGILNEWLIVHNNPRNAEQWLYYGLTMSTLIIVTVYVLVKFSDFQMETLKSVQNVTQALANANLQLEQKVQQRTEELSNANQHLHFLATHDNLTGLPNRALFFDRLEQTLRKSRRANQRFALFFLDLDEFKNINDSFGHAVGDEVLQAVSDTLNETVRDSDTVARLAGDEFTIILDNVQSVANIEAIAQKTLKAISQPIHSSETPIVITASIGISLYPDHGEDAEGLLKKADAAMYLTKDKKKNSYLISPNNSPHQT